jgi:hypothetical protein
MSRTNSILLQIHADTRRSGVSRECARTNANNLKSVLRSGALALIRRCVSAFFCVNLRLVCSFSILIALLVVVGCRSRVIRVSLTNTSEQPLSAIIVDYPTATFGVNTLAPGKTFQYTIKPLDSGVLKIQFTDADGKIHNVTGPAIKKGAEGTIAIRINQDSAAAASTLQ